jgi:hypothetical protein
MLRASWIATALAGVLTVGTPLLASVAGRAAGTPPTPVPVVQAFVGDPGAAVDGGMLAAREPATARRGSSATATRPAPPRPRTRRAATSLLAVVPGDLAARAFPNPDAAVVGSVPASSRYYRVPLVAWIEETAHDGRWGRVELPYTSPRRDGWIRLAGLVTRRSDVLVRVDLSDRWVWVERRGRVRFGFPAAVGAPSSPTPPGRYFVTDRVPFPTGGPLGTFAFGISGIQPRLPAGWSGGDQLAIHGTDDPSSIGRAVSAGCVRVRARTLERLRPLLRLGTPVVIRR